MDVQNSDWLDHSREGLISAITTLVTRNARLEAEVSRYGSAGTHPATICEAEVRVTEALEQQTDACQWAMNNYRHMTERWQESMAQLHQAQQRIRTLEEVRYRGMMVSLS